MNHDVYQMKTGEIETIKIIVKRKTDIGNRAAGFRTLESGPDEIFQTERSHPDMGIVSDMDNIIKNKRGGQGVGINQDDNDSQQR